MLNANRNAIYVKPEGHIVRFLLFATVILYLHKSHYTPFLSPQKIYIGIVLDFSLDIFMSQEKLQTMIMQNFGG